LFVLKLLSKSDIVNPLTYTTVSSSNNSGLQDLSKITETSEWEKGNITLSEFERENERPVSICHSFGAIIWPKPCTTLAS